VPGVHGERVVSRTLARIKQLGPLKDLRRRRYQRLFESQHGYSMHCGVFRSFDEAIAAASKPGSFDEPRRASEYDDRVDRVFPYDYPVMFWLERALRSATAARVLDIGGHVGVHYYAYGKYIDFPPELTWCVSEVAEIAKAGKLRAEQRGVKALEFCTSFADLDSQPPGVILSAGALHYVRQPLLWEVVARAKTKPPHILLNKIPLCAGDDFVSLQNIGSGFAPHYVWNRGELVGRFERLGYRLVDEWKVPERTFRIFDDPVRSFGPYSGVYLRRD
jgi:putative methyltransferase (TIGR04325 family)